MRKQLAISQAIGTGHFAKKQLMSSSSLISWAHSSRFQIGLYLAKQFAGQRVLDYGCGDGTFLAMILNGKHAPAKAVGAELSDNTVRECQERLGQRGLDFVQIEKLGDSVHREAYDAIFCMEVLEHVVDVDGVLDQLFRLLAPGGRLYVSVPIETGIPIIVKQAARRIAGWRGLADYPGNAPYTFREYLASIFAGQRQHMPRPIYKENDGGAHHDHKGFNWRALKARLSLRFLIERQVSSPIIWLPPAVASQVWFLARKPGPVRG
jgi:SAM-dependent methyltransferase